METCQQSEQEQQSSNRAKIRQTRSLMIKRESAQKEASKIQDAHNQEHQDIKVASNNSGSSATDKTHDKADEDLSDHEVSNYNHQCYICDKTFSANSNLNRHLRKIHKEDVQSPYNNVKCALCEALCPSSSMYITHLRNDHQVNIEIDSLTFPDKQTFEEWKYGIENATMSQFIKSRGEKRTKSVNKTYFSCNRSGYYVSKARTQKALKKQGSRKINGRCPASMNVTVNPDLTYDVKFIKTHVGHDFSLKHLDLSEKDRDLIMRKLAEGVTKKDIIKQLRSAAELQSSNLNTVSPAPSASGALVANSSTDLGVAPSALSSSTAAIGDPPSGEANAATSETSAQGNNNNPTSPSSSATTTPVPNQPNNGECNTNQNYHSAPTSRIHLVTTKDIHNILNSKHLDSKKTRHKNDLKVSN